MRLTGHGRCWLALFVAAALVVAACGSDDASTTTAAAPETTAAPATTSAPETTAAPATTSAPETTAPPELVSVSLRLPWFLGSQFAGELVAQEKGFFTDEGLEVTINPGGFDTNSITLVAAGTDTFGLHDMNSLVFAASEGIPLITAAAFLQKHPGAVMARADSGIETLEDFAGATIGFHEGGPWMLTQAMMVKNGVDLDSVDKITVGFDLTPLLEGDIDLYTVFATNEPVMAGLQGVDTTVWVPFDFGVETSANALFTTKGYFEDNPDVVCGMVRAIARGWEYAHENPDETTDIVVASDPDNLDRNTQRLVLDATLAHVRTPESIENGMGFMTADRWQTVVDVLQTYGGLEVDVDVGGVFTDACFSS
ncbi:MAG: ABC transporter substrate-binding protein [bacterium]|nr:ABC transporter substrate-binding protein [bacterium]MDE0287891.1 ABC transporter substrate-binding protein [bacterium]MDE0438638.1 ABC transporter substrate-binding protein [bacterium]